MTDKDSAQTIVFFDGVCHLCNAFVDFLVERDSRGQFRFAALQGQTAKALLQAQERESLETVLVWHQGKLLNQSEAVLQTFSILGGPWKVAAQISRLIPRTLRDRLYRIMAQRRYAWFGKRETCRLPSPTEKAKILD